MAGSHTPPLGLPADAVLYLEGPGLAGASAPGVPRLGQKNQMFVPRVVPVVRGGTVDFPNLDPIFHNVFSVSPTRRFDLGKYPRPRSRQITFPKSGLVKVYCDIHSDMEAFILVVPNRCVTQPDAAGAFRIPDVPPGTYKLHTWHPDFGEQVKDVTVPASGDARVEISSP